jgi:hypothetical protein
MDGDRRRENAWDGYSNRSSLRWRQDGCGDFAVAIATVWDALKYLELAPNLWHIASRRDGWPPEARADRRRP